MIHHTFGSSARGPCSRWGLFAHDDRGIAARGESPRSVGGLRVAGETPDAHAVNRASADLRREDARFSTSTSKFTLERYGSLASTERAHLDREGGVPRRPCSG